MSILSTIRNWRGPSTIYSRYGKLCLKHGMQGRYLILSYDCDTTEDARVSLDLVRKFKDLGVPAVFAVPGRCLEADAGAYQDIRKADFEFTNHGYLDHAHFDRALGRYTSITWYHEMPEADVREDIRRGHDAIRDVLGIEAKGFRAPHFGYYQSAEQLELIYSEAARLGYSYASTTMPSHALRNGAAYPAGHGIIEFPLSGTFDRPGDLLDSWCYMAAPDRVCTPEDYVRQFRKMVDFFAKKDLPCILNYYADPTHVFGLKAYFDCIEYALTFGFEATTYSRLIPRIK